MYGFRSIASPKVPSWVHSDRSLGTTAGLRPVQADMKRNRWPSTTSAACDAGGGRRVAQTLLRGLGAAARRARRARPGGTTGIARKNRQSASQRPTVMDSPCYRIGACGVPVRLAKQAQGPAM